MSPSWKFMTSAPDRRYRPGKARRRPLGSAISLGATNSSEAASGTISKEFVTDIRFINVVHGSDIACVRRAREFRFL